MQKVGDIIPLRAVKNMPYGTFMSWEGEKDILVPLREQNGQMEEGEEYLVIICFDEDRDMYYASEKVGDHLSDKAMPGTFREGQPVDCIVFGFSPLGAKVAINNEYVGLLYESEIFQDLKIGDTVKAFIKQVRQDGKIDLVLQKPGYRNSIDGNTNNILEKLKEKNGFLPYNDKSDPEVIKKIFHMSKGRFKESIGSLYRKRRIEITNDGIKLVESTNKKSEAK